MGLIWYSGGYVVLLYWSINICYRKILNCCYHFWTSRTLSCSDIALKDFSTGESFLFYQYSTTEFLYLSFWHCNILHQRFGQYCGQVTVVGMFLDATASQDFVSSLTQSLSHSLMLYQNWGVLFKEKKSISYNLGDNR